MNKKLLRRAGLLVILLGLSLGQATPPPENARPPESAAPPAATPTSESEPSAEAPPEANTSDANAATPTPSPSATPRGISSLPSGSNVAIIPIEGMIYEFTLDSLQRRVERALKNGASVIVLEIDTYGGVVTAALDIAKYLKDPTEVPVPTVAWVNPKAYSAGIMIAAACDEIVMAPASQTGDCAPIVPGQNLSPTERAKAFSPIASEFKNSAAANGYTYATFHAMCVLGVELYLIEHPDTGQRLLVNQADYAVMVNGDTSASAGIPIHSAYDPNAGTSTLPIPLPSNSTGTPNAGANNAPLTLAEAQEYRPADIGVWRPVDVLPSGQPAPNGRIHAGVGTLFTPDDVLARDISLSKSTIQNDADLQRYLGAASVTRVPQSWSENFAGFLTQLWVRALLVILLVLGVFIEFQSPGLGIPAAVAALALLGLFGAPMVIGLADIWHVLLFMVGLTLLIVELGTAATFGVLGIVGVIIMLAALVLSVVPSNGGMPSPGTWDRTLAALLAMLLGVLGSGVGAILLVKYFGNVPGLNRLILAATQPSGDHMPETHLAGDEMLGGGRIAVGQTGKVLSTLRPAGEAEIDGQIIDVTSVGPYLEPDTPVRVVEVTRFQVVVDEVRED